MRKLLPAVSITALLVFSYLYWQKGKSVNNSPAPEKKNIPTLIPVIKKINKKIPQRLSKTQKPKIKKVMKIAPIEKSIPIKVVSKSDEISIHLQDSEGNLIITNVTIVDDLVIAHGDIIVGQVKDLDRFINNSNSGEALILPKPTLWKDGIIPYVIDNNLPNIQAVKEAVEISNSKTTLRWIERSDQKDFVRFKEGPLNCYSPLGKIGGEQAISLSSGCKKSQVIHEMLHTIGLLHEQNREDRDEFIAILWENIDPKNHLQFKKIKNKNLDLSKHPFDFNSIMLYNQFAFSQFEGDFSIVRANGDTYQANQVSLSTGDLKKINSLYPIDKN
jgi:hypothetical protein